ncbi:MAG: hypothetical protein RIQ90_1020 [Bacteroidota bacterium]
MNKNDFRSITCASCLQRKENLLSGISDTELMQMDNHKGCSFYKKNQSLFLEGSFPRGVFCIHHGKVKIYKRGEEGKEQIIHIAKEGELIGFRAMFAENKYSVSAETLEESTICFIQKDDFLSLLEANPTLRNRILKEMSQELSDRAEFITNMAQKSVRQRLAFSLLLLKEVYGEKPINLSREDLANFVGTATETLIRLLKEFKEEGLVETNVRKIYVSDAKRLLMLVGN